MSSSFQSLLPRMGRKRRLLDRKKRWNKSRNARALANAQLESGIDEEAFRSLPPDIQQELRKNKKTKFEDGFSKEGDYSFVITFF